MRLTTLTALPFLTLLSSALPTDTTTTSSSLLAIPAEPFNATNPLLTARGDDRANRQVTYCEHAHRRGHCVKQVMRANVCYNMQKGMDNRMSSIYPSKHTVCLIFAYAGCNRQLGKSATVTDPGYNSLRDIDMNDLVSSILCAEY